MSRGGYSGGHTIVRADGSFSSYDPAESRYEPKRKRKKTTKSAKKASKSVKSLSLGEQRKSLLNIAADARVSNSKKSLKFPKNIGDEVKQDVDRIGTIEEWAAKQAGFDELVEKKLQKKQDRKKRREKPANSKPVEVVVKQPRAVHKQKSDAQRIALLKSEISQAEEFIRLAENEIKRLQSEGSQS